MSNHATHCQHFNILHVN